jgi:hypothetical protein
VRERERETLKYERVREKLARDESILILLTLVKMHRLDMHEQKRDKARRRGRGISKRERQTNRE